MKKVFGQSRKSYDEEMNQEQWDYGEDEYTGDPGDGEYYGEDGEVYYEDGEYYEDEDGEASEETYYADENLEGEEVYEDEPYEDEVYEDEVYEDEEMYEEESSDEDGYFSIGGYTPEEEDDIERPGLFGQMSGMDKIIMATGVGVLLLALITGGFYINANNQDRQVSSFETVGTQLTGLSMIGEKGLYAVADAVEAKIKEQNGTETDKDNNKDYNENDYKTEVKVVMNTTSIQNDLKLKFVNKRTKKLIGNVPFSVTVTAPDGTTETWTDDDMDGIIYKKGIDSGDYSITVAALEGNAYKNYTWPDASAKASVKSKIQYAKVDVADEIKTESEVNAKQEDTAKKDTEVESELKDTVTWVESTKSTVYAAIGKNQIAEPIVAGVGTVFYRLSGEMIISGKTEMAPGENLQLSAAKAEAYTDWTISDEKWSSDNSKVAVEQNGLVKADATISEITEVTITYTCTLTEPKKTEGETGGGAESDVSGGDVESGEAESPKTVNVTEVYRIKVSPVILVTDLKVSPATLELDLTKGKSLGELTAVVTVKDDTVSKDVAWSSSDEKVATVKVENGKVIVTAVAAGKATITAVSVADKSVSGTCEVTVLGTALTGLQLDKAVGTVYVGGELQLKAATTPENCPVTWKSADETIATVDKNGLVTGVAAGKTDITVVGLDATGKELTAKCTVSVIPLLTLDKTTLSVIVGGESTITATMADGGKGTLKAFSADESSLTVSVKDNKTIIFKGHVPKESVGVTIAYTTTAGETVYKDVYVKVVSNTNKLTDAQGQQLYVLTADGKYVEAVASDYYKYDTFYVQTIRYTGWQTFNGNVYFYNVDGKYVTGEQVIQGAKYNFASDGTLITGSGTLGIDVSKWNGTIDWNAVKNSGVSYVIIRCGYRGSSTGALIEDPKFKTNIKGATAAGLKVGVYFFTQATDEIEAIEEASMVLEMIEDYKISYPVFVDVESSGGRGDKIDTETRTAAVKAFCKTIQDSGYTAGVYANKTWFEKKLNADELTKYKIWLAQYSSQPTYTETRIDLWQYKETGKVSGISGNVDLNLSYMGY